LAVAVLAYGLSRPCAPVLAAALPAATLAAGWRYEVRLAVGLPGRGLTLIADSRAPVLAAALLAATLAAG